MKIIVFDLFSASPCKDIKFHGGGEYIKTIYYELIKKIICEKLNVEVHVYYNADEYIDDWIIESYEQNFIRAYAVKDESSIVNELFKLDTNDQVTFFSGMIYLYGKDKVTFPDKVRTIGTCHGLRTLEKPYDKYSYKYVSVAKSMKEFLRATFFRGYLFRKYLDKYRNALQNFDVIITVSNHSATAVRTFLPEVAKDIDIRVFYTPMKISSNITQFGDQNYIMMISADRWLKNAFRGVSAIDSLYSKGYLKDINTKVYGNYPEKLRSKLRNIDKFDFYGYVEADILEDAYANCSIFFYPTLNEGFGLPPLEAMKYGKTCIVSGICSLPEVYADSVYYCNPYDIMEMENRLLRASEQRIDLDVIKRQINDINNKQMDDLRGVCSLIIGE
ncbi:MAG: glycosyltransferase family 4 protein [Lachnospiraceae bacterium]|nr:glycosyltransferase family 4 protein [Lachnospiraceae bacterium]